MKNIEETTVVNFDEEWSHFDQSRMADAGLRQRMGQASRQAEGRVAILHTGDGPILS